MVTLASLWLPILLSAVLVFLASFVLHMVLRYHSADWTSLPNEDAIMNALRGTPRGDYMMPHASSPAMMKDPAFVEKQRRGPVAVITVMSGEMPKVFYNALVLWFVYSLVVSVFAAYLAGRTLRPGVEYLEVFRVVGTVGFLGYGLGLVQNSIWYGRKWSTTIRALIDALIYGLLSAGVFGWLWPK